MQQYDPRLTPFVYALDHRNTNLCELMRCRNKAVKTVVLWCDVDGEIQQVTIDLCEPHSNALALGLEHPHGE